MLASHASAPAKLNLVVPKDTLSRVASVSDATGLENQIRERAYQLYEKRGREHGKDQQDWVQAEHEMLK